MRATASEPRVARRRGRPPKFGRPAFPVTITLPFDVVESLRRIHPDLAHAIVRVVEGRRRGRESAERPLIELVTLPGGRALILVEPKIFRKLPGVSAIPLADGRAFLALEHGRGFADFELAVIDRLEQQTTPPHERDLLQHVRTVLRNWRREGLRFESRSIMVAIRPPAGETPQPLAAIRPYPGDAGGQ